MEIIWSHNDHILKGSDNYGITTTRINKRLSSLSIEDVQAEHSGTYTCNVTNRAGSVTYSANLVINGIFKLNLGLT